MANAGIENLRVHDLRRTGASSYVIGKTLGHKDKQATDIYDMVSKDVTRDSMENAANEMFKYAKVVEK